MTDSTQPPTASDAQTDTHGAAGDDPAEGEASVVLLHVEPDADSASLLAAFAEGFADGSAVRSVDGMAAALDAADAADCVVTEQQLPDGSGVELVERLRARGNDVPVAFHTTCREPETEARALDAGADAFFAKRPERGRYDRLVDRLRRLVGGDDPTPAAAGTSATVSDE
jgi:DNA-binding response OmpR family regulator